LHEEIPVVSLKTTGWVAKATERGYFLRERRSGFRLAVTLQKEDQAVFGSKSTTFALSGLSLFLVLGTGYAASEKKLASRIERAKEYFDELMADESTAVPRELMRKCTGVVILRQYKAGLVFGVKGGFGVALAKDEKTGQWSPPAFIKNAEGSYGLQIGGQSIDTVLVIVAKEGLQMLMKSKFKVGVDASAAAGPVGRDAEAKVGQGQAILVYSAAKGLYAGAVFEGGLLMPDNGANEKFYSKEGLTLKDILFDGEVKMPEEAKPLVESLEKHSK
jgi:lipid-binding SYLF domain-containing protein